MPIDITAEIFNGDANLGIKATTNFGRFLKRNEIWIESEKNEFIGDFQNMTLLWTPLDNMAEMPDNAKVTVTVYDKETGDNQYIKVFEIKKIDELFYSLE